MELGAQVVPTTELAAGGRLAQSARTDDRLIGVLETSPAGNAAVLVEIGIAIGMGLPVQCDFINASNGLAAISSPIEDQRFVSKIMRIINSSLPDRRAT